MEWFRLSGTFCNICFSKWRAIEEQIFQTSAIWVCKIVNMLVLLDRIWQRAIERENSDSPKDQWYHNLEALVELLRCHSAFQTCQLGETWLRRKSKRAAAKRAKRKMAICSRWWLWPRWCVNNQEKTTNRRAWSRNSSVKMSQSWSWRRISAKTGPRTRTRWQTASSTWRSFWWSQTRSRRIRTQVTFSTRC